MLAVRQTILDGEADLRVPGGIELLVLEGALTERGDLLERHSWLRMPAGAVLQATAGIEACWLWVSTRHLRPTVLSPIVG